MMKLSELFHGRERRVFPDEFKRVHPDDPQSMSTDVGLFGQLK